MNRPYLGAYSKTRFLEETGFLGTIVTSGFNGRDCPRVNLGLFANPLPIIL